MTYMRFKILKYYTNFLFIYFARCVGFMMAKMVLRELMDPLIFNKFKSFLTKVYTKYPTHWMSVLVVVLNSWLHAQL